MSFLGNEACEFCVKLTRAIFAIVLDGIIAAVVVAIATGLAYFIERMIASGADLQDLQTAHRVIIVVTMLVYGGWGIWHGIKGVRKATTPPC